MDRYLFRALNKVREITERWMKEYNPDWPHETLET
ncbi:hypothetical protein ABDJ68_004717 [Enterobacter ludwigii]